MTDPVTGFEALLSSHHKEDRQKLRDFIKSSDFGEMLPGVVALLFGELRRRQFAQLKRPMTPEQLMRLNWEVQFLEETRSYVWKMHQDTTTLTDEDGNNG